MNVAFDYLTAKGVSGIPSYTRGVATSLCDFARLNLRFLGDTDLSTYKVGKLRPTDIVGRCYPEGALPGDLAEWESILSEYLWSNRTAVDVHFSPAYMMPQRPVAVPIVVVIHDVLFDERPSDYTYISRQRHRRLTIEAVARASALICVSKQTADKLIQYYGHPRGSVYIIPNGVSKEFIGLGKCRVPSNQKEYILTIMGYPTPRKNLKRLLEAYNSWCLESKPPLVVVAPYMNNKISSSLPQGVSITGAISQENLLNLLKNSLGIIYPSLAEGFGLPVLEAMAAGIPVLCSRLPSIVEFAKDYVDYFDPLDSNDICRTLNTWYRNETSRTAKAEGAMKIAREFTWHECAKKVTSVLEEVYSTSRYFS